jgi:hypothetical protein
MVTPQVIKGTITHIDSLTLQIRLVAITNESVEQRGSCSPAGGIFPSRDQVSPPHIGASRPGGTRQLIARLAAGRFDGGDKELRQKRIVALRKVYRDFVLGPLIKLAWPTGTATRLTAEALIRDIKEASLSQLVEMKGCQAPADAERKRNTVAVCERRRQRDEKVNPAPQRIVEQADCTDVLHKPSARLAWPGSWIQGHQRISYGSARRSARNTSVRQEIPTSRMLLAVI